MNRNTVLSFLETSTIVYFVLTRLFNGVSNAWLGELSLEAPEWVFGIMGNYPLPKNFGWDWIDPALVDNPAGDEYNFWENIWILRWNIAIALY